MPQILVVDDDPFIRALLRSLLGKEGHDVREARDGHEALRAVAAARPDLVLCDLFMPGLGGLQTIRELARAAPGLPVVVMSSGAAESRLDALPAAARLGAAGALDKPFSGKALLAVVKRVLAAPAVSDRPDP